MVTPVQKRTSQAIVNIFETGRVLGDYASVTYHAGDLGQLTYGRSQTTLASGNLFLLITDYCRAAGAQYAEALTPFLPPLADRDPALNTNALLRTTLHTAGSDPVMQAIQDAFFDRNFWSPAVSAASGIGIVTALGTTTVYDSWVHGSWAMIRDRTNAATGTVAQIGEKAWISAYIATRRQWLASFSPPSLLPTTVYRMDSLQSLVTAGAWDLPLPLTVRGVLIDMDTLDGQQEPVRASAETGTARLLRLTQPYQQGDDVRALQTALGKAGFPTDIDGAFGPGTATAVKSFQTSAGLTVDGIVGPTTRNALDLPA
jgi:chitosanase